MTLPAQSTFTAISAKRFKLEVLRDADKTKDLTGIPKIQAGMHYPRSSAGGCDRQIAAGVKVTLKTRDRRSAAKGQSS